MLHFNFLTLQTFERCKRNVDVDVDVDVDHFTCHLYSNIRMVQAPLYPVVVVVVIGTSRQSGQLRTPVANHFRMHAS